MQRKYLAAIGFALLLALSTVGVAAGLGPSGAAAATADDQPTNRSITVDATGEASATPDRAVIHLAVRAEGETPSAVRDELVSGAEDLRAALDELGVEYETVAYSVDERYRPPEQSGGPTYEGVHRFEVTLDDPNATGSVVDAAADADASVDRVRLTLSDEKREELRTEAIQNAMDDARQQADTIAAAADLSVTSVLTVDAAQSDYSPVAYEQASAADSGSASTTIDSGDVSVTYDVQVSYEATE